jgi:hypothetical protein
MFYPFLHLENATEYSEPTGNPLLSKLVSRFLFLFWLKPWISVTNLLVSYPIPFANVAADE